MTQLPMMISDTALAVENSKNIVTPTPPSFQTPLSTFPQTPLESQCQDPFRPTAWQDLTSVVHRPQRWLLDSSTVLSKTVNVTVLTGKTPDSAVMTTRAGM
jgi:hypothetical protein